MTTETLSNEALIRGLPFWSSAVDIKPLEGGITNHNYLASLTGTGDSKKQYVVRLGADIPVHQIKRFNEIAAGRAAHEAGLSPAICYHQEGVLIMDYIPSKALTEEDVRKEAVLGQVVDLVKRCHTEVPLHLRGASVVFWVFHVIRDYAATLRIGESGHMAKLDTLLKESQELQQAAGPFEIVFGHNDLLPANILDDGNRLWLIDWEYGGFNTPLFDLGGLASNNGLDETAERWMLARYFGAPTDNLQWRQYSAMKCASLLRETMWSMVSEIHSTIDFDYSVYTAENLSRYEQSLADFRGLPQS